MANNILVVFAVEKALPPPVSQQDSSVSVHDEAQVDVVINAELAGETAIATSAKECPAGEVDHADHDVTEERVTDVHCEEPPMQQQDGIGVGMSINEGDNAMDQLAATATEHHFNDVLEQLPVQTIPTDSDTTGGTMGMSTTTFSPPSQLQTLVNVNDGKCNVLIVVTQFLLHASHVMNFFVTIIQAVHVRNTHRSSQEASKWQPETNFW